MPRGPAMSSSIVVSRNLRKMMVLIDVYARESRRTFLDEPKRKQRCNEET